MTAGSSRDEIDALLARLADGDRSVFSLVSSDSGCRGTVFACEGLLPALCRSSSGRACTNAAGRRCMMVCVPACNLAVSLPGSCSQALAITTARGVPAVGGRARVAEGERVAARAWDTLESLRRGVGRYRADRNGVG